MQMVSVIGTTTASQQVPLYQSLVQSIVLHKSEIWTIKNDQKRKLKTFEMAVPRNAELQEETEDGMWTY